VNRIAATAAAHLARGTPDDVPITAEEIFRLLARIARVGPPAARLRALELMGGQMGLFQGAPGVRPPTALSDEEGAARIGAILDRAPGRREIARAAQEPG
jgi:hypothetical protein